MPAKNAPDTLNFPYGYSARKRRRLAIAGLAFIGVQAGALLGLAFFWR
ncbi:hypothetical protein [Paraburkholderia terrae]|nr:hypothetical protein [Paraburkholderia terrae]GJH00203.1 hypothetical protein CBA19C8_06620 [Paraburkholderia terrae]